MYAFVQHKEGRQIGGSDANLLELATQNAHIEVSCSGGIWDL